MVGVVCLFVCLFFCKLVVMVGKLVGCVGNIFGLLFIVFLGLCSFFVVSYYLFVSGMMIVLCGVVCWLLCLDRKIIMLYVFFLCVVCLLSVVVVIVMVVLFVGCVVGFDYYWFDMLIFVVFKEVLVGWKVV